MVENHLNLESLNPMPHDVIVYFGGKFPVGFASN